MSDEGVIRKAVGAWNAGMIGRAEFVSRLIEAITPENVDEFLKQPADVVSMVRAGVAEAPSTEAGWRPLTAFLLECEPKKALRVRHAIQKLPHEPL